MEFIEGKRYKVMSMDELLNIGYKKEYSAMRGYLDSLVDDKTIIFDDEFYLLGSVVEYVSVREDINVYSIVLGEDNRRRCVPTKILLPIDEINDEFVSNDLCMLL